MWCNSLKKVSAAIAITLGLALNIQTTNTYAGRVWMYGGHYPGPRWNNYYGYHSYHGPRWYNYYGYNGFGINITFGGYPWGYGFPWGYNNYYYGPYGYAYGPRYYGYYGYYGPNYSRNFYYSRCRWIYGHMTYWGWVPGHRVCW